MPNGIDMANGDMSWSEAGEKSPDGSAAGD